MELKKIVFIHAYLLHYHYPRLQALSEECQKKGIEFINIEITNLNQAYELFFEDRNKEFINITLFPGQKLETLDWNQVWISLRTKLIELEPNVIFLYGYANPGFRRLKFWAEKNNVATVLISDSNVYDKRRNFIFEFLKSLFVSRFDGAFVGGTDSCKYLQKLGISPHRIVVGYDVIDNGFYLREAKKVRENPSSAREKWNLSSDYFLFVGRLIEEKNLWRLLEAYNLYFNSLYDRSVLWNLVLCGSGPEEGKLRQKIGNISSQCGEKISIYGHINHSELINFYACANCLILPSISETWGLVVNEALACSLPVIVSNRVGCAADLVKNCINGWLFDPFNIEEMAHLMVLVSESEISKRNEMGLAGYQRISEWDVERFSRGALEIAEIAIEHKNHARKN
jgi:glycosyltransferase involved in cell wall biosynthesis